ncbi:MAG TPA: LysR substrate-binding domain-containing protein [Casimicrobiaceae bacterium]|nr:LysR substrate-binding domain-containing protein [Casimicrobiaceae bacterium]
MPVHVQPSDLGFFSAIAAAGSLSAAARELGVTTPAVSKRLAQIEARLGMPLVVRTTRRLSLTPEGEIYRDHARRILGDIEDMEELLGVSLREPQGLLRVNATLGFGRSHVAPLISRFVRKYSQVQVQLQLSVNPPPMSDDAWDVCIRFGEPPDARVIARQLASNRRLLCAAPSYLAKYGKPRTPRDLMQHNCIGIRQGDEAYGVWRLSTGRGRHALVESIKIKGNLTTNDGEIAVSWALDGRGILMRAEWDIARYLRSGRLLPVLPQYDTPDADIHAVYPQHHQRSSRVRAFVDFLTTAFAQQAASTLR